MEGTKMSNYEFTTQKQVRRAFWASHPNLERRRLVDFGGARKQHVCDTRCGFVDFVDMLAKDGHISSALARRVTL